jgi:hypothetical protein
VYDPQAFPGAIDHTHAEVLVPRFQIECDVEISMKCLTLPSTSSLNRSEEAGRLVLQGAGLHRFIWGTCADVPKRLGDNDDG